ncbi:hypothetical protein DMUE_2975 [Dictyocoela muelleri]|nr:hypothetical protein DMUE_2975 [Dictyocoela muelleri]
MLCAQRNWTLAFFMWEACCWVRPKRLIGEFKDVENFWGNLRRGNGFIFGGGGGGNTVYKKTCIKFYGSGAFILAKKKCNVIRKFAQNGRIYGFDFFFPQKNQFLYNLMDHSKIHIIMSKSKGEIILYDGYVYNIRNEKDMIKNWRCQNRKCSGAIKTLNLDILNYKHHNHDEDFDKNEKLYYYIKPINVHY